MKYTLSSLLCVMVMGLAMPAEAATILSQDFEDTGVFSPGITGFVGSAATVGGRWGAFDTTFTRISNTVARGGSQSHIATRGSVNLGRTDAVVTTDPFDVSYWLNRGSSDSQLIIQVGNSASISSALDLATFVRGAGEVNYYNGSGWVGSGGVLAVGQWYRVRLSVDADAMTYDLFLMPDGGSETLLATVSLTGLPANINAVRFNPQGVSGNETYVDDVTIEEIPVPEPTALALVGLAGWMMFGARRVRP